MSDVSLGVLSYIRHIKHFELWFIISIFSHLGLLLCNTGYLFRAVFVLKKNKSLSQKSEHV